MDSSSPTELIALHSLSQPQVHYYLRLLYAMLVLLEFQDGVFLLDPLSFFPFNRMRTLDAKASPSCKSILSTPFTHVKDKHDFSSVYTSIHVP